MVIDTRTVTIALPDHKLAGIWETLRDLAGREKCTQRELLSVVVRLVHASKCVPPGRAFTRRLLDAAYSLREHNLRIRITAAFRADFQCWLTFLPLWNGVPPLVPPPDPDDVVLVPHTDSSRWGMGA